MATIRDVEKIKVGDKIKTDYEEQEKEIVRTVLKVQKNCNSQTGIMISCDGGETCPHCGNKGTPIREIDIVWVTWFESKKDTL